MTDTLWFHYKVWARAGLCNGVKFVSPETIPTATRTVI